ncbi:hypothetical protein GN956_G25360 [Arapaima gigas]
MMDNEGKRLKASRCLGDVQCDGERKEFFNLILERAWQLSTARRASSTPRSALLPLFKATQGRLCLKMVKVELSA